jgi:hypothetical protein
MNERLVQMIPRKNSLPNCVGNVDGTVFPLAHKPTACGEEYLYLKDGYSLHCLVICDDEMSILDYLVG